MATLVSEVIEMGAARLATAIAAGELTSREVVDAFIERIEQVDGKLNAVVVRMFDEARKEALAADEARRRGDELGPLHGVPITVKECFFAANTPSCGGLTHLAAEKMAKDGLLVRRLRDAGAILLGKTNLPQMMVYHESDNPVYGRTNNPHALDRTPGGSTGGEAAIVAAGGSPMGLAGDLGGSIRIPAHFCGVCGIKPTTGRLPRLGSLGNLRGMEVIQYQPGPIARRVEDLAVGLRALDDRSDGFSAGDVSPQRMPTGLNLPIAGMRIGFWKQDGYFEASPAVCRAVEAAASALKSRGAELEIFDPPDVEHAMQIYLGLISADGGADLRRLVRGSELDRRIKRLIRLGRFPRWLRPATASLLQASGQHWSARLLKSTGALTADAFWQTVDRMKKYSFRFFADLDRCGLDAMIFPPHALPALPHGFSTDLMPAASYSFLANLLGIPAGVVPVTNVRADETGARRTSGDRMIRKAIETDAGSAGLPVGVQVAARHWREDIVLSIMAALEDEFGVPALATPE